MPALRTAVGRRRVLPRMPPGVQRGGLGGCVRVQWRPGRRGLGGGCAAVWASSRSAARSTPAGVGQLRERASRPRPDTNWETAAHRELLLGPAPERLEQMMCTAITLQVGRVRGAALGIRDRVIQVTADCGVIASRPATRQIPAPHEIGQRLGRHISRLRRRPTGMHQRQHLGRLRQLGY
jgi:hypothetical protein